MAVMLFEAREFTWVDAAIVGARVLSERATKSDHEH
jgi:hypothetical protein